MMKRIQEFANLRMSLPEIFGILNIQFFNEVQLSALASCRSVVYELQRTAQNTKNLNESIGALGGTQVSLSKYIPESVQLADDGELSALIGFYVLGATLNVHSPMRRPVISSLNDGEKVEVGNFTWSTAASVVWALRNALQGRSAERPPYPNPKLLASLFEEYFDCVRVNQIPQTTNRTIQSSL